MVRKRFVSIIAMIGLMIGGGVASLVLPLYMDRLPLVLAQTVPAGEQAPEGGEVTSRAILAQESIFLRLGNIKGKAMTQGFQDWVVINDFSYQITQSGAWEEGNRLSGRITVFGDVTFEKLADISSPSLALACATKEQFPRADLALVSGRDIYMKVSLEGVIVSSVKIDFDPASGRPKETFTLNYRKATWEWGTARAGYDLRQNVKM
jgi:type VI secretion system Hcp family effector